MRMRNPHPRCQATHLNIVETMGVEPPQVTLARALAEAEQPPADYDDSPPQPLERLVLQPGDTLVVRLPAWASEYDRDRTRNRAREQLPAAVGVVVVAGDELAVIRPDTRHLEVQPAELDPDALAEQRYGDEPLRNVAIRLARAHEEIRIALNGTPERERIEWEQMPASYRARLANVLEEMLAQGLIKP